MDWSAKTILVTGLTGSFGTAFSHYLAKNPPKKLICFSRGWLAQKNLRDELGDPSWARWFVGDVRDKDRLMRAFKGVDIVIHAAAIKDLDACNYNPSEAMLTNVQGTQNVVDACIENRVNKAILISTDKSIFPANTYGASKALAEKLWIHANKYAADDEIKFSVCRWGNVIGSNGSVVLVWRKLIAEGATELPLTDEQMTRYWFKMENAIQLVVDSLDKMQGGEIFTPTMPSIWLKDLAAAFGMPYKVVGIREGEKLHEQIDEEHSSGTNPWFLTVREIKETIKDI